MNTLFNFRKNWVSQATKSSKYEGYRMGLNFKFRTFLWLLCVRVLLVTRSNHWIFNHKYFNVSICYLKFTILPSSSHSTCTYLNGTLYKSITWCNLVTQYCSCSFFHMASWVLMHCYMYNNCFESITGFLSVTGLVNITNFILSIRSST